jgi:hypothetical protein
MREGLLRPEFRDWYPSLTPGIWYPAASLTQLILVQLRSGEPRWQSEGRVPAEAHFEFRGGEAGRLAGERTRRSDAPAREK